jgi:putative endonuclease
MYYDYAISSLERNYIYVGLTDNIERRLSEHNMGKNKTTKPYSPFAVIYFEECSSRIEARIKEKYLKKRKWKGKIKNHQR